MSTDEYIRKLCQNIHAIRTSRQLSEEEMARILDVDTDILHRIERGDLAGELKVESLVRIQNAFGIPIKKLFE